LLVLVLLPLQGCSATRDNTPPGSNPTASGSRAAIESTHTGLDAASCRKEIDKSDPNETPYLVCPGAGGYALIVRRVESGRQSIDVVNPSQRVLPLNYHEVVTRHMSSLIGPAEWRVKTTNGRPIPVALIVRVQAREDNDNPEKVTRTYLAVAKIAPDEACVTDRVPDAERSEADVRSLADSAQDRPCAPALPPMSGAGAGLR
jgi:hypothetical protein